MATSPLNPYAITPTTLPCKFTQHLPPPTIKAELDKLWKNHSATISSKNFFELGNYVCARPATDISATLSFNLHPPREIINIYVVRKTQKIRDYLQKHHITDIVVPQKYLYFNTSNELFVLHEKIQNLSEAVIKPADKYIEFFKSGGKKVTEKEANTLIYPDQSYRLYKDTAQISLTASQSKHLAELAFLGFSNVDYNNLFFDQNKNLVLISTQPKDRALKKLLQNSFVRRWLINGKSFIELCSSLIQTSRLKTMLSDTAALQEVKKVENRHLFWYFGKLIAEILVLKLALLGALWAYMYRKSNIKPLLPQTTVLITFMFIGFLKLVVLSMYLFSISKALLRNASNEEITENINGNSNPEHNNFDEAKKMPLFLANILKKTPGKPRRNRF